MDLPCSFGMGLQPQVFAPGLVVVMSSLSGRSQRLLGSKARPGAPHSCSVLPPVQRRPRALWRPLAPRTCLNFPLLIFSPFLAV